MICVYILFMYVSVCLRYVCASCVHLLLGVLISCVVSRLSNTSSPDCKTSLANSCEYGNDNNEDQSYLLKGRIAVPGLVWPWLAVDSVVGLTP